eukprot:1957555-Pyramimonas_sp.AAC.1
MAGEINPLAGGPTALGDDKTASNMVPSPLPNETVMELNKQITQVHTPLRLGIPSITFAFVKGSDKPTLPAGGFSQAET